MNAGIDEAFEVLGGSGYDQKSMEKLRSKMHVAEHEDHRDERWGHSAIFAAFMKFQDF